MSEITEENIYNQSIPMFGMHTYSFWQNYVTFLHYSDKRTLDSIVIDIFKDLQKNMPMLNCCEECISTPRDKHMFNMCSKHMIASIVFPTQARHRFFSFCLS